MSRKILNNLQALKPRRKSRVVMVGDVGIGGGNPVRVQTMTNTDTLDIQKTVAQITQCYRAGAELIRLAAPSIKHAQALGEIKAQLARKKINIPLVADVHFSAPIAFEALKYADKIRLNPGNFLDNAAAKIYTSKSFKAQIEKIEKALKPFIQKAKELNKPIRIGANHGSLSPRILSRYGNTANGMVESAMEYLRIFQKHDFHNLVVAIKSSDPAIMIETNRLLASQMEKEKMDYPIHLGVTEAGNAEEGRIKSAIGIGVLLLDGIGDTIRVSLTESPVKEISAAYNILQAARRRITKAEFISCPSCGRTQYDIEKITNKIKKRLGRLKGARVAIMGCIVNGLGEMADADFGYVGGARGKINLYYKKKLVKQNIPEEEALEELEKLVKDKMRESFNDQ